jgi:hypothetical protein
MPAEKPKVKLICAQCYAEFEVQPYRVGRAKFCGFKCKQIAAAIKSGIAVAAKYRGTGTIGYVKFNGRHEHRVVAEQMLGRPIIRGEIVHHLNGDKHDNRPENLQVMTQSEHLKVHHSEMISARKLKAGY